MPDANLRDQIWYMALILGLVSGVAGLALAGVKSVTDPVIEKRTLEQLIKPSLDTFFADLQPENDYIADRVELDLGKDARGRKVLLNVFQAKKAGEVVAVALQTAEGGYGGDISVLTALELGSSEVLGVKALSQSETKGLGARVSDDTEPFIQQFSGLSYAGGVKLLSDGGQVEAISGATISSTAFTAAVHEAVTLLGEREAEILGDAPSGE